MKTLQDLTEIVSNIEYNRHTRSWAVVLAVSPSGDPYLQVQGMEAGQKWTGKKWKLSYHMTTTEVVYTAFKAVQAAEDHEMREFFTYKGVPVCHPHVDVEYLVEVWFSGELKLDSRPDSMEGT